MADRNLIDQYANYLVLKIITAREQQILELRFARGLSQYQVALGLDLSRSTIKSTERNALRKIRLHHERKAAA